MQMLLEGEERAPSRRRNWGRKISRAEFVAISGRSFGSGYLGPKHQPLFVQDANRGVENLKPLVKDGDFNDRVGCWRKWNRRFTTITRPGQARLMRRPIAAPCR